MPRNFSFPKSRLWLTACGLLVFLAAPPPVAAQQEPIRPVPLDASLDTTYAMPLITPHAPFDRWLRGDKRA